MNAYSEDLRRKIVDAVERGMLKSEVAHLFGVSLSSVKRYAKMAREGRPLSARKAPGKCPKIDERARRLLKADLEEHPAATLGCSSASSGMSAPGREKCWWKPQVRRSMRSPR